MATLQKNYSNSANGWDVTIYWECDYDDTSAYMYWVVNKNSYGRTFNIVESGNTSNRYNSGSSLTVGKSYYLYVYKETAFSQQAGPFTITAPVRPKYTISYNANGGSGAPDSQTKTHGYSITLSTTKPTRTGHTFLGWATSSTATSASYDPGDTYSSDANLTLYAVWKAITYNVTFDANGGSGTPSAQTKTYGVNLTLSSTKPTREGYTFKQWNTAKDGTGTAYSAGGTYSGNAAVTLFAIWTANQYTVKFNNNGGSGSMSDQTMTYDTAAALKSNIFTKTGYSFMGWSKTSGGSVVYQNGQSVKNLVSTSGGSITLYAVWGINSITIIFDAVSNGGTTPEASRTINYGSSLSTIPVATKPYYKFVGWFTAKSGGSQINATTVFTSSTTIYAQFVVDSSTSVNVKGTWKKGIPYVNVKGVWKKGYAKVKSGNWKQGIG